MCVSFFAAGSNAATAAAPKLPSGPSMSTNTGPRYFAAAKSASPAGRSMAAMPRPVASESACGQSGGRRPVTSSSLPPSTSDVSMAMPRGPIVQRSGLRRKKFAAEESTWFQPVQKVGMTVPPST